MAIRVLIADDQALVRGALVALLNLEADIEVVAELGRGDQVLAAVHEHNPDVVVLDIEMPGLDGIAATAQLRAAQVLVPVLIVTTFGRPGYLRRALAAGAGGFVVKDRPAAELAAAIRSVLSGELIVDPHLAMASAAQGDNPLTDQEGRALRAARTGAPVKAIATQMSLSEGTVRNYLSAAMAKTQTKTRAQAALVATENGWI